MTSEKYTSMSSLSFHHSGIFCHFPTYHNKNNKKDKRLAIHGKRHLASTYFDDICCLHNKTTWSAWAPRGNSNINKSVKWKRFVSFLQAQKRGKILQCAKTGIITEDTKTAPSLICRPWRVFRKRYRATNYYEILMPKLGLRKQMSHSSSAIHKEVRFKFNEDKTC